MFVSESPLPCLPHLLFLSHLCLFLTSFWDTFTFIFYSSTLRNALAARVNFINLFQITLVPCSRVTCCVMWSVWVCVWCVQSLPGHFLFCECSEGLLCCVPVTLVFNSTHNNLWLEFCQGAPNFLSVSLYRLDVWGWGRSLCSFALVLISLCFHVVNNLVSLRRGASSGSDWRTPSTH